MPEAVDWLWHSWFMMSHLSPDSASICMSSKSASRSVIPLKRKMSSLEAIRMVKRLPL